MPFPDVFIHKLNKATYPKSPFSPNKPYPELDNLPYKVDIDPENEVYEAVRNVLFELGFDRERYGAKAWNPFKDLVPKGAKVVIKPNFVKGAHPLGYEGVLSMLTHASMIRPIIDYLLITGSLREDIVIGDAPLQSSVWDDIIGNSGVRSLVDFYKDRSVKVRLLDFRKEIAMLNAENIIVKKSPNKYMRDENYIVVDLAEDSSFTEVAKYHKLFSISDYDHNIAKHHNARINEYCIPKEILEADLIINIPKLKTHRKAGLTCAMKNLIGINGDKSWIPHHRSGARLVGGDEFEKIKLNIFLRERVWRVLKSFWLGVIVATLLKKLFRKFIWRGKTYEEVSMNSSSGGHREGSWHGNDTIWRSIKDLNKILYYADKCGQIKDAPQRKSFCIVDAVLSGEGEGPMEHTPIKTGLVFGGINPAHIDFCAAAIMGFNSKLIPSIARSFEKDRLKISEKSQEDIVVGSNTKKQDLVFRFKPSSGWRILEDKV